MCIPTRTQLIYNNDKPWFTAKLSQLRQAKEDAYRKGDNVLYKQAKYTLEKEIKVAKRNYSDKIRTQFTSNDSASVWKSLKEITNYKTPPPSTVENQRLADDLNEFYCRFERRTPITCPERLSTQPFTPFTTPATHLECLSKQPFSPFTTLATRPEHLSKQPPSPFTPPASPLSPTPAIQISEDAVRQVFRKQKRKKAPGPDCVTPACLKSCADQLAPIFTQIFNRSLELCEVPSCFKRSTIIPIPKKSKITGLNDYRPVALTSVVMKSFEKLVLAHLKDITGPLLDPLQFAYRANRSVDDAVNIGLYYVLQHLDRPGTYVRILFVDFSSAFNTIIPNLLLPKLTQLSVPTSICQWINSFLTDRQQLVRLGKYTSSTCTISTGAPQGCVLSPLLFYLYTKDCTSKVSSVKLLKFADDTTLIGLIQDGDESAYRQEVKELAVWCSLNNLELNTHKTVEMIVDF